MNLDTIFRAYDIRGKVPAELTPPVAHAIGRAFAQFLPEEGPVAVGRDMRPDSEALTNQIIKGITATGRDVWDIGLVTSDMVYFAVGRFKLAGGAMITASHNPGEYNGIKLCREQVQPVGSTSGLLQIKQATAKILKSAIPVSAAIGQVTPKPLINSWIDYVLSFIDQSKLNLFTIAIDAANGVAGLTIPPLLKQVPYRVVPLFFELDGTFPNHPPNPMVKANLAVLIKTIHEQKLDFGIAFDGDGDRAFFVDDQGNFIAGDIILALMANWILKRHKGAAIAYDLRCSRIVKDTIEQNGGRAIRTRVGHPFIYQAMREVGAVLGGESSGHFYFEHNFYNDSGLIAAMVITQIFSEATVPLSELAAGYQKYAASGEINFKAKDKTAALKKVAEAYSDGEQDWLDGLTVNYPYWWFNLRPSNTEPLLRLNVEARAKDQLDEQVGKLSQLIAQA